MRGTSVVLLCLLTWRCYDGANIDSFDTGVVVGPAGGKCTSDYVTVANIKRFPIAGCYKRTTRFEQLGDFSYANYEGKVVEGMARDPMIVWNLQLGQDEHESPWVISELGDRVSVRCISSAGVTEGGWKSWECSDEDDETNFEELLTCGCSDSERQASERYEAAWVDARRNRLAATNGRDNGAAIVAGASGEAEARVSRVLSSGEFHSFWMWVIIAGSIAGLIVLCCIGWYIRNPFFCQKAPPADPSLQPEDAAPQAPKTAFQPWGASAPPK